MAKIIPFFRELTFKEMLDNLRSGGVAHVAQVGEEVGEERFKEVVGDAARLNLTAIDIERAGDRKHGKYD